MIHPTAIIDETAKLAEDVEVGPYAVIGKFVTIGSGTWVGAHAVIDSWTDIGRDNRIFQFASVGAPPQDLKYHGEETHLTIGDYNQIREFATLHRGTVSGGGITRVGSNCLFMAYSHVAHDCVVNNQVIMANGATLAGHVSVGENAILGGLAAIHQFTRVGCHTMISGGSMVAQDIPPYTVGQGDRAKPIGLNLIGLKRRGFSETTIRSLKQAFRLVFRSGLRLEIALQQIIDTVELTPEVVQFVDFIKASQRGVAR